MGIKLVIVDDAPFIREAVRAIVVKAGFDFIGEAADGEEALEMILKKNPDVVIMDLVLPKKNGIEVTKEILALRPNTKVIACSTEGQEAMLIRAIDAGCVNFVSKPFVAEDLVKAIRTAMEK